MAGRRVLRSGAEAAPVVPGEESSCRAPRAGSRASGFPPASYFFGKTPVWLVPPQKTLVPNLSRRPVPSQVRQRRYPPL
jgi:hypothetical protein